MVDINSNYCPQNHSCPVVETCPYGAISQENSFSAPKVDDELCTECGICTAYCPVFSLHKEVTK